MQTDLQKRRLISGRERGMLGGGEKEVGSGANNTCALASLFYTVAGDFGELLLRYFGNMALRHYDGTPRAGHTTWRNYFVRTRAP